MKKILLTIIGLALASSAWSAQTAVTEISGVQPSVGALKTQVNTKLGTVESNRQDHETRVAAMETGKASVSCFANASAFNACFSLDWQSVDASGFNGNLSTTDDTLQEIAQKVDDLVFGSGSGTDDQTAAEVPATPWGSYTGTNVQALMQEVDTALRALIGGAALPTWFPSTGPTNGRQIMQATGGCSLSDYDNQTDCETNSGTWTTPTYQHTSIISGLINDTGTADDDLWSAAKIISELATKQASLGFVPENTTNKDVANGYAGLGSDGKISVNNIPALGYDSKQPGVITITSNSELTSTQVLDNKYITNFGSIGTVTVTLPALTYQITRTAIIESPQILKICPPTGESLNINGDDITVDYCIISSSVIGSKTTVTRRRNGSYWIWDVDGVRGTWTTGL